MSSQAVPNLTISPPRRIPELDGIRGLAIVLVLLYHYVAVPIPANATGGLATLRQLLSNTWSGVDLFFVLSGYLIAGILIDNRTTPNYFKAFYARRVSRIFPLYYFFLALFLLLQGLAPRLGVFTQGLFANSIPILPYWFYLQNLAMAVRGTFGSDFLAMTWSLAIEEHFYLLLPLVVRRSKPTRLPILLLFLVGLTLTLRAMLAPGTFIGFVLTPWRLDGLFLGCLLAILFRRPQILEFVKSHLTWIKIACGALFIFITYSSMTEPLGSLDHLFVFGMFYGAIIVLTLVEEAGLLARFFRTRLLANIGKISYGIYLFHQLVNGIIQDLLFKAPPAFQSVPTALATAFALVITYLLATGTYNAFEKRFIAFGHKYRYTSA